MQQMNGCDQPFADQPALLAALAFALSLLCGYSQRHLTAVHFGCSPTHCAI
jgi:hypothetical protein